MAINLPSCTTRTLPVISGHCCIVIVTTFSTIIQFGLGSAPGIFKQIISNNFHIIFKYIIT